MNFDYTPVLKGDLVELRPLSTDDCDDLYAVASDPRIWEQHPVQTLVVMTASSTKSWRRRSNRNRSLRLSRLFRKRMECHPFTERLPRPVMTEHLDSDSYCCRGSSPGPREQGSGRQ